MTQTLRSPLKRIGGKSASAGYITGELFPPPSSYDRYVEPCGGAAHIILSKPRYHHEEIFCDLDNNLIAFWLEMSSNADGLQTYLDAQPYAREVYYTFYRSLFNGSSLTQFERAARYFYCLRSTGTGWLRKSPVGWDYRGSNVQSFRSAIELFEAVQERFRYVAIDNRHVLSTLKRFESSRTFFYCDPPYFGVEQYYEASKKGFPHQEMAYLLNETPAQVAISYYPHPEIDRLYPAHKWRRVTWQQHKSSQIQIPDRGDVGTELLLMNYPEQQEQTLWN